MATQINIIPTKTYATRANAVKAVEKKMGPSVAGCAVRYFIFRTHDDRYLPVFVGNSAVEAGVHFHFNVVG